jgi:hypothetical protein
MTSEANKCEIIDIALLLAIKFTAQITIKLISSIEKLVSLH